MLSTNVLYDITFFHFSTILHKSFYLVKVRLTVGSAKQTYQYDLSF